MDVCCLVVYIILLVSMITAQSKTDIGSHVIKKVIQGKPCNTRDHKVNNGRVKVKFGGKLLNYICNRGYMLVGDKFSVCVDGEWSHGNPVCAGTTCSPQVSLPSDGVKVTVRRYNNLIVAYEYMCQAPDYILQPGSGDTRVYCDGTWWIGRPPTCVTIKPRTCTFENEAAPLCDWTNDDDHDIDWEQHSEETMNEGTGPDYDHTLGQADQGHYLYVNAYMSSPGEVARVASSWLYPQYDWCVTFWYHMYGQDADATLVLTTWTESERDRGDFEPLLILEGNYGNMWKYARVDIPTQCSQFQVVFQATMNTSMQSDVAIDDVTVSPCNLLPTAEVQITTDVQSTEAVVMSTEAVVMTTQTNTHIVEESTERSHGVTDVTPREGTPTTGRPSAQLTEDLRGVTHMLSQQPETQRPWMDKKVLMIGGIAVGVVLMLLCLGIVLHLVGKRRNKNKEELGILAFPYQHVSSESSI